MFKSRPGGRIPPCVVWKPQTQAPPHRYPSRTALSRKQGYTPRARGSKSYGQIPDRGQKQGLVDRRGLGDLTEREVQRPVCTESKTWENPVTVSGNHQERGELRTWQVSAMSEMRTPGTFLSAPLVENREVKTGVRRKHLRHFPQTLRQRRGSQQGIIPLPQVVIIHVEKQR
jgi:hypothetical protein